MHCPSGEVEDFSGLRDADQVVFAHSGEVTPYVTVTQATRRLILRNFAICRNFDTLRVFYRWAVATGRCGDDLSVAIPVVRASTPNPRPLPDIIYLEALRRADARSGMILRLGAEMGLRRSEVARLHSDDILPDLDGFSLRVHGKGGKERVVPMPDALARDVCALPLGWAFPGDDDGHLSPRWVGTLISRLLPPGWTMHKLRHRFATRAYAVDRDVFTVQELLGHASPATTRAYVKVPREGLRRTVQAAA